MDQTVTNDINFQQIVENSLNGVLIIGKNGKIHYHNQTILSLLNCQSSQLLGNDFYLFLHKDYHELCRTRIKAIVNEGQIAESSEQKLNTFLGEQLDVEVKGLPYTYKNQSVALVYFRDITKQKKAERLLTHSEKLSSIGQISAGIAHEVRNPLTSVKGFVQLLQEEHQHPYYQIIETELQKAINTLNNLLQVSKPDLADEPLSSFNMKEELDAVIFLFQEQLYEIELEKHFEDRDIIIQGKRNILLKAFFNLIKNAIEAIEGTGKIVIDLFYTKDNICLKIADTGKGISQENLKMIGTPFYSTKSDGTGMGLTQVFTTVQEHDGEITVESTVGVGTTFTINLPIK
ncbi:two-component system sensor histidine kinase NtrB [Bacillus suaedae]|uniref:histidine kinase n=1 Tax=Halalkalibacter suaedae TaxID=2822140 RepID=A0A940WTJ3_9BACI|nr:ATP-binding protein [Bacillus suaedae]MBP3952474.1 PAS domain S-box protein [Bacillus suaedae]